ncbi:MAG: HipA N-terminal domain-containing protein [Bacteroidia bacterium]
MLNKIQKKLKDWFSKGDEDLETHLPLDENATFMLKVDNIEIGKLHCENGVWEFAYTDEFKKIGKDYNLITGFPDLNKVYRENTLWPFFRVRIPGLKQPGVQEIIKKEKINQENEVSLLKRFGQKTISNPYVLISL